MVASGYLWVLAFFIAQAFSPLADDPSGGNALLLFMIGGDHFVAYYFFDPALPARSGRWVCGPILPLENVSEATRDLEDI